MLTHDPVSSSDAIFRYLSVLLGGLGILLTWSMVAALLVGWWWRRKLDKSVRAPQRFRLHRVQRSTYGHNGHTQRDRPGHRHPERH